MPAKAMMSTWSRRIAEWVPAESRRSGDIGGAFQTTKAMSGLNEPRMALAIAKLISTARSDCLTPRLSPSNGASMALSSALPPLVNRMINGNLIATIKPCRGERQ